MTLPQELIDHLVSFIKGDATLGSDDTDCRRCLSACAQTSRSFRTPAQRELFSNMNIDCTRMESRDSSATMVRLIAILDYNNDLLHFVLSVKFKFVAYARGHHFSLAATEAKISQLLQIFRQCPNLKRIALAGVGHAQVQIVPESLETAISDFLCHSSVVRLDLTMVTFCPSWKISSHIVEVYLDRADYAPSPRSPSAENLPRKRGLLDFLLPESGSTITELCIGLPVARRSVDRFSVDLFHLNSYWHVLHVANLLPNHPNLKRYRICVDLADLRILTVQPDFNVDNIKQEVRSSFSFVKPADVAERFAGVDVDIEVVPPTLFF